MGESDFKMPKKNYLGIKRNEYMIFYDKNIDVLKNKDEFDQYFISATLQEDKTYDPIEEEKCETCSGCGFH